MNQTIANLETEKNQWENGSSNMNEEFDLIKKRLEEEEQIRTNLASQVQSNEINISAFIIWFLF